MQALKEITRAVVGQQRWKEFIARQQCDDASHEIICWTFLRRNGVHIFIFEVF